MKQHQLRAFLALAEGRSLSKAATLLNKTTAAVSKSIRELEDDFQVQLFHRMPSGMTLAEGGKLLLPRAQAMLAELTRAQEALANLRGRNEQYLRVGLTPAVSVLIAPTLIETLARRAPSLHLEIYEYQREQIGQRLDDGTLDVALYALPSFRRASVDQRGTLLYSTRFALAVRHGGKLAQATSLADLQDARWIFSDPSGAQQQSIEDAFRAQGMAPPASTLLCSAAGLGISLALRLDAVVMIARPIALAHDALTILPEFIAVPQLQIYSLVRAAARPSASVDLFLQIAGEVANAPLAAGDTPLRTG